jgi:hypothetical protein
VITCAVGWYLRFSLSYRNVEELLTERGFPADHISNDYGYDKVNGYQLLGQSAVIKVATF